MIIAANRPILADDSLYYEFNRLQWISLLLLIALVVFGAARIIYGIARYELRERKPRRQVMHPDFGTLTSEGSVWEGTAQHAKRGIPFVVGGTEAAPDDRLLAQLRHILPQFEELERRAMEYLRRGEPDLTGPQLDLYMLEIIDEDNPEHFTFEFIANGDDSGVWRVAFVAGEPRSIGYDD